MSLHRELLFFCLCLLSQTVNAHAMGSSFLHIEEQSPGKFVLRWVPDKGLKSLATAVEPHLPQHCKPRSLIVDCGTKGLVGPISFTNLPLHADVVVRVEWLNGNQLTEFLADDSQSIILTEADNGAGSWYQVLFSYTLIGIEHILTGIDHLLFVLGLVILVGYGRRLLWTITAFTLAHSLTLALSVTGLVSVSQTPVEIVIALSIMLVAAEALDTRVTLARNQPWLVAFIFGLVHGLGFAGALREVGLPEHALLLSLFSFNLGVELGQLTVVLGLYGLSLLGTRKFIPAVQLRPALSLVIYLIGGFGAYWSISRTSAMFGLG